MAEYIEREAVEKFIEDGLNNPDKEKAFGHDAIKIMSEVHFMPAADVAPVVHGRWIYDENATDWGIGGYICSECKNKNNNLPCNRVKTVRMFSGAKYCPNCGAKMDGSEDANGKV